MKKVLEGQLVRHGEHTVSACPEHATATYWPAGHVEHDSHTVLAVDVQEETWNWEV